MLTNTKNILKDLVEFNYSVEKLERNLSSLNWDIDEDLIYLEKKNILKVLQKFIDGYLTNDEVERWANLIECREGIKFDNEIKEIIYELANPDLTFKLQKERACYLINILRDSGVFS